MAKASGIAIRPATPDDRAFIEAGVRATFHAHALLNPRYFHDRRAPSFLKHLDKSLSGKKGRAFSIATADGQPIGYVATFDIGPARVIQDIFVSGEHRKSGVGTALLEHVSENNPGRLLHATVWDGNDASHALFISRGFQPQAALLPKTIANLFPALRATHYFLRAD